MTKAELESMTKDELVDYAATLDVEVSHSWLKDEMIKEILKAEKVAANKPDSVKHLEGRQASIKAENSANDKIAKETSENQEIVNSNTLPQDGETRDQLLARIRKMREAPPAEPEAEPFRSEGLQKEFDAEQEAGRAAVAKAKEVQDKMYADIAKHDAEAAAGEKNR